MQRRSARRADGADRDVETALDALYTTPPPGFVTCRTELAAEARSAGRGDDARRLRAARRPTLAAWAANLLLRSRPREAAELLELGRALREAYRTLDAVELKSLNARRNLVTALSRQAAELADERGQRLSAAVRQEVESTLSAVLADQEAADRWATGRLHVALTPPSVFPAGDLTAPHPARPRKPRAAQTPEPRDERTGPAPRAGDERTGPAPRAGDELAERRRARQERLSRARESAETATRRLTTARTEESASDTVLRRARERREAAEERVAAAARELREAREEARQARREQRRAEESRHTAEQERTAAEQETREAERTVRRLEPRGR
ncbi:hypothetical protein [Streptomyces ziwulingensis]|uniref:Transposase n=1 Tax=Streptomyces ziwulingensis TaxID=1045501 RepID=A0ABP9BQI7_9ACTN